MERSELEQLICLITTEVLRAMETQAAGNVKQISSEAFARPEEICPCRGGSPAATSHCCKRNGEDSRFEKRVLCAADLGHLEGEGMKRILLSPQTIITPLAAELAREKQILLVRAEEEVSRKQASQNSKSLTILSRSCTDSQREAVITAVEENGYSAKIERALAGTTGMVLKSAVLSAQRLARGETDRLIVLDENVYPLSVQLKKLPGIRPKICWNAEAAAENRNSNVLLLNCRQLGIQILRRITGVWLQV